MGVTGFENFINFYSFDLETKNVKEFLRVNLYEIFWKSHCPIISIGYAAKDLYDYMKSEDEIRSVALVARISISLVGLGPLLFVIDLIGTLFKVIYGIGGHLKNTNLFSKGARKIMPYKS